MIREDILELIDEKSGIRLDIGCGGNKQPGGFVGIDYRPLEGVDIVHDLMLFPWPLPDECVTKAVSSHLLEHIPPFPTDPKLIGLIHLLWDKGILDQSEMGEYMGYWDSKAPGFMRFMDEAWRVLKVDAQFAIAVPHALSGGFPQDPTHINMINENTFRYFDPFEPVANGGLWRIYKPKPWELTFISFSPAQNVEVILRKRSMEELNHE